jgi:hypothetical protein
MNNTISLSLDKLQRKQDHLDSQIKKLQAEKGHIEYVITQFFEDPSNTTVPSLSKNNDPVAGQNSTYDSSKNTKELIVDILRTEGKKMKWRSVFEMFHQIKPEIAVGTVQVSLSQMSRNTKYPVKLKKAEYWYEGK